MNQNQCHGQIRSGRVRSFRETLEKTKTQIELSLFGVRDLAFAEELALIITEVMHLDPRAEIRINGEQISVEMAQEIYARLCREHIEAVIRGYRQIKYKIKHTKTYLRTALYNSVFELEARTDNEIRNDFPVFPSLFEE